MNRINLPNTTEVPMEAIIVRKDRPLLAELLEVEVGKTFYLDALPNVPFYISADGNYTTHPPYAKNSSFAIMDAIQNPSHVRRECVTSTEKRFAKLLLSVGIVAVSKVDDVMVWHAPGAPVGTLPCSVFPSLRTGHYFLLEEVVNSFPFPVFHPGYYTVDAAAAAAPSMEAPTEEN